MDATERFAALVRRPDDELRLDEASLLVAAHAHRGLDVSEGLADLDRIAEGCPAPAVDPLLRHLFVDLGFSGDRIGYDDPRNSLLSDVLHRRLGIPITLGVVAMEVGRRLGLTLEGVGMPGHFLLRDGLDPDRFIDPFSGGVTLDRDGCEALFRAAAQPDATFRPGFLEPVRNRAVIARILANLKRSYAMRRDLTNLSWVLRLRAAVPGVPPTERRALAKVLAASGRFVDAASEFEALAGTEEGEQATRDRAAASRLRARLN